MIGAASAIAHEPVAELAEIGFHAFTTTRDTGSFNVMGQEPAAQVMSRWYALIDYLGRWAPRFASAPQVHGITVHEHDARWTGWLRATQGDGHFAPAGGTAMAVTVADCVPVFLAHPYGAAAVLHAGWRGTADHILDRGVELMSRAGFAAPDLRIHLGPAICGTCYEVGPEVYERLTGQPVAAPARVDLRALLAARAEALGVRRISVSRWCTRCHNDRFFSHRCGDLGRQLGVIVSAQ
jgi:YfiH family protein